MNTKDRELVRSFEQAAKTFFDGFEDYIKRTEWLFSLLMNAVYLPERNGLRKQFSGWLRQCLRDLRLKRKHDDPQDEKTRQENLVFIRTDMDQAVFALMVGLIQNVTMRPPLGSIVENSEEKRREEFVQDLNSRLFRFRRLLQALRWPPPDPDPTKPEN